MTGSGPGVNIAFERRSRMLNVSSTGLERALLEEIDVTLVAARRPELLELTLRSFRQNLLRDVSVRRLHVNLDPIWGSEEDAAAVRTLCKLYFDDVILNEPAEPSFSAAVKWLWSQSGCDWFLHLEDDWCLVWRIDMARLAAEAADSSVGQISFFNHRKAWRRGVWSRKFTTSPSLIRSSVARAAAGCMDTSLDPEKQLYDGRNPAAMQALSGYRHRFHGNRFAPLCIADTGRAWRAERNIEKTREEGVSAWSEGVPPKGGACSRAALDRYERRLALAQFLPRI